MIPLTPAQYQKLQPWFMPERAGPLIGPHILQTGHGTIQADRWPEPRALLSNTAGNCSLAGDATTLIPTDLHGLVGVIEAPTSFVPLLEATFDDLAVWDRVIYSLAVSPQFSWPEGYEGRRLTAVAAPHLQALSDESSWIAKTWGGADGLTASGYGWGAWWNGRLVSVACTFFLGEQFEEIGVVTESDQRGRGLSVACAGALCQDIQARGHTPSWTTSTDNIASQRVAAKLGFCHQRDDVLYVTGLSVPKPPTPS